MKKSEHAQPDETTPWPSGQEAAAPGQGYHAPPELAREQSELAVQLVAGVVAAAEEVRRLEELAELARTPAQRAVVDGLLADAQAAALRARARVALLARELDLADFPQEPRGRCGVPCAQQ